ncbi:MAG: ribulose-5-phosphate 4-epimerase/fuculose-1-phosphate aldolase [Halieaceae bacterium]|jgi:ribulose-5-phosphate 4-epimerase/fuculose-1-phosphate aldolase
MQQLTSIREQVSAEEWEQRVNLAAAYRLVARYGWDDLIFTHISARVPGTGDEFLINPFGLMFDEVTASSLVKINADGEKVVPSPFSVNPAGFTIHSAVHQVRHDADCVIHLHTVAGTAVSTDPRGLLPLNQTALLVRDEIAYHDFEGVAVDLDERPRLQRDLGEKSILLLRNHGTLALGETVAEAFMRIYFLERACEMQVATLSSSGGDFYPTEESVQEKVAAQGRDEEIARASANLLAWPALLRRLDRLDPSYRD